MTNVVDQISLVEPTADISNIYLAWWDSYLYNKCLTLIRVTFIFIYISYCDIPAINNLLPDLQTIFSLSIQAFLFPCFCYFVCLGIMNWCQILFHTMSIYWIFKCTHLLISINIVQLYLLSFQLQARELEIGVYYRDYRSLCGITSLKLVEFLDNQRHELCLSLEPIGVLRCEVSV